MSVIVAYSAAATGSPLNKAKPPKHSLNETGKFIILRLTVSPKIFPHCLTVADCNPCGASQIHIGVIKPGSSGRELTREIMIIVTIVRTVSIAKNSPYRIERYRECYIVFANTISPLWLCSYCNVSPTQNVVWSYTRYSSQCCIGAIAIPSTSS